MPNQVRKESFMSDTNTGPMQTVRMNTMNKMGMGGFNINDVDTDLEETGTVLSFSSEDLDLSGDFKGLSLYLKYKKVASFIFITMEVPSSSTLAKYVSLLVYSVIIIAVLSYIISTVVSERYADSDRT
jgi:hypothetical protein